MKKKIVAAIAGSMVASVAVAGEVTVKPSFDIGYIWADNYTAANATDKLRSDSATRRVAPGYATNGEVNDLDVNMALLTFSGSNKNIDWKIAADLAGEEGLTGSYINEATLKFNVDENFSVTAGRMYSHMGYETMLAKDNWNYSRSFAFKLLPFWHEGVGFNYDFKNGFSSALYLYGKTYSSNDNGDNSSNSAAGLRVAYTMEKLAATVNYIQSKEANFSKEFKQYDINAVYTINDQISTALAITMGNGDVQVDGGEKYSSFAGYVKFKASERIYAALRYEMLKEKRATAGQFNLATVENGFAATNLAGVTSHEIDSLTLTGGYDFMNGSELKLEYKMDTADKKVYYTSKTDATSLDDKLNLVSVAWLFNY
jgi:hypothetical protein